MLTFAENKQKESFTMRKFLYKSLIFSILASFLSFGLFAQHDPAHNHSGHETHTAPANDHGAPANAHETEKIKPKEVIYEHVKDGYSFHFFETSDKTFMATIPLPVILYSKEKSFDVFMSSKFHHGHEAYKGYRLVDKHFLEAHTKAFPKMVEGDIVAVNEGGHPMEAKFYDFSLTRNVVQMFIALFVLGIILMGIAKKYKNGVGLKTAPKGFFQNALEPLITFVRDDVGKSNIGHGYQKYVPLLLTMFFFILINNIFGLIPGSANVTGNIAVTAVLGIIAFIVVIASTNKHFWAHIFWPPVPHGVKLILVPVELIGIFTKHISLILRLFANMLAGHVIIISLISLIFIFTEMAKGVGIASIAVALPFTVFIYLIEVLVAFVQAYIFCTLTAVFIGQSREGNHDEDHAAAH